MHPCLKPHYHGVCALLALSEHIPDKAALLSFLGSDIEKRFDLALQSRLDLAVVCHRAGEIEIGASGSSPVCRSGWTPCTSLLRRDLKPGNSRRQHA